MRRGPLRRQIGKVDAQSLSGNRLGRIVTAEMNILDKHVRGDDDFLAGWRHNARRVVRQSVSAGRFARERREELRDEFEFV